MTQTQRFFSIFLSSLFAFTTHALNFKNLSSFVGTWQTSIEKCHDGTEEKGKIDWTPATMNIKLVNNGKDLEISYLNKGVATKNFTTLNERFHKINHNMDGQQHMSTTEVEVVGNKIIVGAIHKWTSGNQPLIGTNITELSLSKDKTKIFYGRKGHSYYEVKENTNADTEVQSGYFSYLCEYSKK